jgi:hypothetical protein
VRGHYNIVPFVELVLGLLCPHLIQPGIEYLPMNPSDDSRIDNALNHALQQCRREQVAYEEWLRVLSPLRWICVGGGVLFSAAAGITIIWNSLPHGRMISAILAFSASVLTGLHVALKCDPYQAECHRILQALKSLGIEIEMCREVHDQEYSAKAGSLIAELASLLKTASASPSTRSYRRAERTQ